MSTKALTINDRIATLQPQLKMALGDPRLAERFERVALTAVKLAPNLQLCTWESVAGAIMMAAQLGMDFSVNQAHMIPYRNNKTGSYEAQFQLGYQGLIELFYRHPLAKSINVEEVYPSDQFELVMGTDRQITHKRDVFSFTDEEPIGFYATAELKTGARNFAFISMAEAKKLQSRYGNTWRQHLNEMAKKTAIKRVLKIMPKSTDILMAMNYDDTIRRPVTTEQISNIDEVPAIYPEIEYQDTPAETPAQAPEPAAGKPKPAPKAELAPAPEPDEPPSVLDADTSSTGLHSKKESLLKMVLDTPGLDAAALNGWEMMIMEAVDYGSLAKLESEFKLKYGVGV